MNTLYYDCFCGISGDMHLAALLDLGVEERYLLSELGKLPLGGYEVRVGRTRRNGIAAARVEILLNAADTPHRRLADVHEIIERSSLNPEVKRRSLDIFRRLAQAEASVHGISVEEVHFHEVGAMDALVDIVGGAIALERLGADRILSSSVELGSGAIECAHGTLPVPAPATEELLRGKPTRRGGVPFEATTPTGAAILSSVVNAFTDSPALTVARVGYGAGQRETAMPNLLRALLSADTDPAVEPLVQLESNIDDMNPELYDHVLERLLELGANDVWLTPVVMKKGRPAIVVGVLCTESLAPILAHTLLCETTTLGVRRQPVGRTALERETREVATRFGPIAVKVAFLDGEILKAKPEYEACRRIAREHEVPIQAVYDEVARRFDHER